LYCTDWALANVNSSVWEGSLSQALENVVCMHLHRRWPRVNYYLTRTGRAEVDFIAADLRGKPAMAVQVCMDMTRPETAAREVAPLAAAAKYFGLKEALIVTLDQEQTIRRDGVTIRVCSAPRWLMEAKGE